MSKQCLKCAYTRQASDAAPSYKCPRCGAIYAKVEAARQAAQVQQTTRAKQSVTERQLAQSQLINVMNVAYWLALAAVLFTMTLCLRQYWMSFVLEMKIAFSQNILVKLFALSLPHSVFSAFALFYVLLSLAYLLYLYPKRDELAYSSLSESYRYFVKAFRCGTYFFLPVLLMLLAAKVIPLLLSASSAAIAPSDGMWENIIVFALLGGFVLQWISLILSLVFGVPMLLYLLKGWRSLNEFKQQDAELAMENAN
ncbi:hypothetical protein HQ393_14665 [Chitinibacter bivalviorum]|uniref:Uncharacterized protein n=1 Tax=Chitinibacter bivalviorum TaxID=2739434 RepID=A0A7H9BL32_9NEIS|nr:hypothetical protein [Chitinibacter bivalviorum]QLG89387.1 hypothetical protein HQ393_14665 [Chitinibacter bivalviorum]